MQKKTFTTQTTAAAELFNAPPAAPAPAPAPAQISDQASPAPAQTSAPLAYRTWRAKPDGERRDQRLQIICKPSIAAKAAEMARARGISVAYLFETLIDREWNNGK